jgi:hypothetical protein
MAAFGTYRPTVRQFDDADCQPSTRSPKHGRLTSRQGFGIEGNFPLPHQAPAEPLVAALSLPALR